MLIDKVNLNYKTFVEEKVDELRLVGVKKEHARCLIDCLLTADSYGVNSHGLSTLSAHIEKIKLNLYNLEPNFSIISKSCAFAVIDGDNAIGPVSATHCMNYAVKEAKKSGIFTVFSRNNNTFGPAFYYPLIAAKKGLIGIAFSNSPAQMAPIGGKEKKLGTNPISIVIPCGDDEPIIFDMATSIVAKSKFKEFKHSGKNLPDGWALDIEGIPTNDPDEGIKGFVLPMAGMKGYGIAMIIDVLSGLLSGSAFLDKVGRFYSSDKNMNVGFNFIAIDPAVIMGKDEYLESISEFVKILRDSKNIEGKKIILPGDDRVEYKREWNILNKK